MSASSRLAPLPTAATTVVLSNSIKIVCPRHSAPQRHAAARTGNISLGAIDFCIQARDHRWEKQRGGLDETSAAPQPHEPEASD